MRKMHDAKQAEAKEVVVWGTGTPRREFFYSDDMADACVFLMKLPDAQYIPLLGQDRNDGLPPLMNIGVGHDLTIRELAETIKEVVGYTGMIVFDSSKPDGTLRKLQNVDRIANLGWHAGTTLEQGLTDTYRGYLDSANVQP